MQLQRITKHTAVADRNPSWHVIDADGERLGRLASKVAALLQGKHRADYSRHQIAGDFVVIINAAKVAVSGDKLKQKIYYRHTGYQGGLRSRSLEEMLSKFPERVIEQSVKGMLPRNRLGRQMLRRIKVYGDASHPHEAQIRAGLGIKATSAKPKVSKIESGKRPKTGDGAAGAANSEPAAITQKDQNEVVQQEATSSSPIPATQKRNSAPKKPVTKSAKSKSTKSGTTPARTRRTASK